MDVKKIVMCLMLGVVGVGCAAGKSEKNEEVKPQHLANMDNLQEAVGVFHRDMRWSRFEQASLRVAKSYRQTFMGRYEEFGEDFHMTHLEVKRVSYDENPQKKTPRAIVEVEQEWYKEPNMTVKKERFVEAWEPTKGVWQLTSRMKKEEWKEKEKERKQEELEEKEAKVKAAAAEGQEKEAGEEGS